MVCAPNDPKVLCSCSATSSNTINIWNMENRSLLNSFHVQDCNTVAILSC